MKDFLKENWYRIFAIVILVGALWNHPYSYFQILRWIISIVGAYSAYLSFNSKRGFWGWIFVVIAIVFNPIAPIFFQKQTWAVLDIIASILMFVSIIKLKSKKL